MGRKLLHTLGYNDQGIIVHVNDAVKSKSYSCPLCGERIIARNGGKSQRPHFAHFKKSEVKCNGESVLSHYFKMKTLDILQEHLNNHSPFHIKWNCPYCSKLYNKDVLQKIVSIKDQCIMNGQPSVITLLGDNGQPLIVIEITIRRKLTKKILEFYESNHIILIHYQLHENDWMNITQKLSQPNHVTFCGNPECYNFQFYQNCIQREIFLQKFKCKKCNKIVDGYMVRNTSAFGVIGLDNLTTLEKNQIISTYFRGKRATTADIVVYGKCRCTPHSKGLVCLTKSELIKETQKGKITKKE